MGMTKSVLMSDKTHKQFKAIREHRSGGPKSRKHSFQKVLARLIDEEHLRMSIEARRIETIFEVKPKWWRFWK